MLHDHTPVFLISIAAAVGLFLTVILDGGGNCSTSSADLPSLARFFLKLIFVGRGCNMTTRSENHVGKSKACDLFGSWGRGGELLTD